jgi:hypothetical protein
VLSLAEFNRETSALGTEVIEASVEEEAAETSFDISPELMYTTEHEIPADREYIVMEPAPNGNPVATGNGENVTPATRAGDRDDTGARRRRGRRGGRRGRGGEQDKS